LKAVILFGIIILLALPANSFAQINTPHVVYAQASPDLGPAMLAPNYIPLSNETGSSQETTATVTLYNGTQFVENGQASPDYSLYSRPLETGWMTGAHSHWGTTTQVEGEISFPNTNPSQMPSGSWIEGTINLQGQTHNNGVDWIMRAAYVLYQNGNHGVVADVWKDCEGYFFGCGQASATELTAYVVVIIGLQVAQPMFLKMAISSNTLYWYYSYDNSTWYQYQSWSIPSNFISSMYLGTVNISSGPYFTAYYYQFGVWTSQQFNNLDFDAYFQKPSFWQNGHWNSIPTAESMSGPYTYFDQTWTYSSNYYVDLKANAPQPSPEITFYATPCCYTIKDNTKLWG
jgi:hypothetical protein